MKALYKPDNPWDVSDLALAINLSFSVSISPCLKIAGLFSVTSEASLPDIPDEANLVIIYQIKNSKTIR